MRRADAAMYEAKTTGRDVARFYSIETDQRAVARQTMEQQLRRALERHGYDVFSPVTTKDWAESIKSGLK